MVSMPPPFRRKVVALCGGVGGAKLALGLAHALAPGALDVVVNTADDFRHLGLHVSPDVDTVLYTLAGVANPQTGWGRAGETWNFMDALAKLGGETWFKLGDTDLAIHVERTWRLAAGESLSAIVDDFRRRFGVAANVVPMSDDPVATVVETTEGPLAFQHYFVRDRCAPIVTGFRFEGASEASAADRALAALADPELGAVVICPSNPYVSIDPILAVPDLRRALGRVRVPIVAVSPIIGGRAIKGPTAKMMAELGIDASTAAVARHYAGLIDGFVLDVQDREALPAVGVAAIALPIVMRTLVDRVCLARAVLTYARGLDVQHHAS